MNASSVIVFDEITATQLTAVVSRVLEALREKHPFFDMLKFTAASFKLQAKSKYKPETGNRKLITRNLEHINQQTINQKITPRQLAGLGV